MSDQNSDFQPQPAPPQVDNTASYQKRFFASMIDIILVAIILVFFMRFLGLEPSDTSDTQAAQAELAAKLAALPESQKIFLTFSPLLIFFGLHSYSLYQYGQTLGKRMMGIAIVTLDNQKPTFFRLISQRYFPQWLMGMVPLIGLGLRLADILLIFRSDKRCLHDLFAGTKVIDLRIKVAAPQHFIA